MNIHDSGYKKLFSNRTIFRQLIETFVDEPWVSELDFSQARTLDKSYVDDHYKETESDLIYQVALRERNVYIYVLIEFQSTVDKFMAMRVLHYVSSIYMDLIRSGEKFEKLPPIFPIVLYNGDRKWTAPLSTMDLIAQEPSIGRFALEFEYFKIAENEYSQESLLKIRNIVSTLFLTESHYNLDLLTIELLNVFENEADRQAASLLLNWFRQLREHGRIIPADYDKLEVTYSSVEEARTMLITALEKEREQIREEGRREGIEQGIEQGKMSERIEIIMKLLARRFDNIPNDMSDTLARYTLEQLDDLMNPALDALDIDAFLAQMPKSESNDAAQASQ